MIKLDLDFVTYRDPEASPKTKIAVFVDDKDLVLFDMDLEDAVLNVLKSELEFSRKGNNDENHKPWKHPEDMQNDMEIVKHIREIADKYEKLLNEFTTKSRYASIEPQQQLVCPKCGVDRLKDVCLAYTDCPMLGKAL